MDEEHYSFYKCSEMLYDLLAKEENGKLSIAAVAKFLGMTTDSLHRAIQCGKVPFAFSRGNYEVFRRGIGGYGTYRLFFSNSYCFDMLVCFGENQEAEIMNDEFRIKGFDRNLCCRRVQFEIGYRNTGNRNTGNHNTGDCNTGYRNTGDRNTGLFNKTNYSNGVFCTIEPKICMFNIQTDLTLSEFYNSNYYRAINSSDFTLTQWDSERNELIVYTYEEACEKWWNNMNDENKEIIKSLPNFDIDIFCEITGIDKREI